MIEELLSKGYGVEDIALERGLPIEAVRDIVAALREAGRLAELIRKGRVQSNPPKCKKTAPSVSRGQRIKNHSFGS